MAGNPSKGKLRQQYQESVQDLANQSFDPTFATFLHQLGGTPDGTNFYLVVVNSDGSINVKGSQDNRFTNTNATTNGTVISASGENTIYTPASGKKTRLKWLGLSASQNNTAEILATVKIGTKVVYQWYLGNPGAFAHWEEVDGSNANDPLIINLSGAQSVAVSYTVQDI